MKDAKRPRRMMNVGVLAKSLRFCHRHFVDEELFWENGWGNENVTMKPLIVSDFNLKTSKFTDFAVAQYSKYIINKIIVEVDNFQYQEYLNTKPRNGTEIRPKTYDIGQQYLTGGQNQCVKMSLMKSVDTKSFMNKPMTANMSENMSVVKVRGKTKRKFTVYPKCKRSIPLSVQNLRTKIADQLIAMECAENNNNFALMHAIVPFIGFPKKDDNDTYSLFQISYSLKLFVYYTVSGLVPDSVL